MTDETNKKIENIKNYEPSAKASVHCELKYIVNQLKYEPQTSCQIKISSNLKRELTEDEKERRKLWENI